MCVRERERKGGESQPAGTARPCTNACPHGTGGDNRSGLLESGCTPEAAAARHAHPTCLPCTAVPAIGTPTKSSLAFAALPLAAHPTTSLTTSIVLIQHTLRVEPESWPWGSTISAGCSAVSTPRSCTAGTAYQRGTSLLVRRVQCLRYKQACNPRPRVPSTSVIRSGSHAAQPPCCARCSSAQHSPAGR